MLELWLTLLIAVNFIDFHLFFMRKEPSAFSADSGGARACWSVAAPLAVLAPSRVPMWNCLSLIWPSGEWMAMLHRENDQKLRRRYEEKERRTSPRWHPRLRR